LLASTEGQVSTIKQGVRECEGHSRTGEHNGRDKLGQKKQSKQGALTDWRAQRHGQVSTVKASERTTVTYQLKSEGGID
jgi:hypothetical protein